jgi:hypothetical protein
MARIRTHDTTERRKNKVVKTYGVVWREPDRDQFGLPVPVNPDHPRAEVMRAWRETYSARRATRQGPAPWPSTRGGARLARRAGGEGQPREAHGAHGQASSLAPADH